MHELEAIWALTWRDLKRFSRDRSQILGALARPLLWLVFMGKGLRAAVPVVAGVDYQHFIYAGAIAMTVLFSGMFQSVTIIWDREFGFLKEVLVAPISRPAIVLGKTLSGAAVTFVQGLMAAAFAPLVAVRLGPLDALALAGVIALLSLAITGLGVVIATRMETFEGFGVISNFVVLPLYFLSGGVFPIENLPGWMALLVHANPVTYGVDLMRRVIGQPAVFSTGLDVAVVCGFGAAMVGLALLMFRRE
ncbi:MAG TPA: ABC transporter permease [Polyangia bacterium]|nr:ABC transporter permease [Polyangia bacterium]